MSLPDTRITISDRIYINGQPVLAGNTIALRSVGNGTTAVTLTIFTDDLTVCWEDEPAKAEFIAPDHVFEQQAAMIRAAQEKEATGQ